MIPHMPIPEFNQIKPPALQLFADGKQRKTSEVDTALAREFNLSQEEQNEMLPSGTQGRWRNRVLWALYDLFRAGLFDRPKRGVYVISESGRKLALEKPKNLDREFLMQYPQFVQFAQSTGIKKTDGGGKSMDISSENKTPQELIESACQTLYTTLKKDLLDSVKQTDPFRFQQIVIDVLLAMGYGEFRPDAAQIGKKSNDHGIDGIINEDKLGLDGIYGSVAQFAGKKHKEQGMC
jgi:restriction system protein